MASRLAGSVLIPCSLAGGGGEELERARKLLEERAEKPYREGADVCAEDRRGERRRVRVLRVGAPDAIGIVREAVGRSPAFPAFLR
jgi:hypothetical protein